MAPSGTARVQRPHYVQVVVPYFRQSDFLHPYPGTSIFCTHILENVFFTPYPGKFVFYAHILENLFFAPISWKICFVHPYPGKRIFYTHILERLKVAWLCYFRTDFDSFWWDRTVKGPRGFKKQDRCVFQGLTVWKHAISTTERFRQPNNQAQRKMSKVFDAWRLVFTSGLIALWTKSSTVKKIVFLATLKFEKYIRPVEDQLSF